MTVKWNPRALDAVTNGPEVTRAMLDLGDRVAATAANLAPKNTGAGARSIHAEKVTVNGVPEVRVSWDRAHFYMAFHELGTEDTPARPFLRPAAAQEG